MPTRRFDYRLMLETRESHGVEHVVVGGVCATAHGAPVTTFDLDLVHARTAENIDRMLPVLVRTLQERRERGESGTDA